MCGRVIRKTICYVTFQTPCILNVRSECSLWIPRNFQFTKSIDFLPVLKKTFPLVISKNKITSYMISDLQCTTKSSALRKMNVSLTVRRSVLTLVVFVAGSNKHPSRFCSDCWSIVASKKQSRIWSNKIQMENWAYHNRLNELHCQILFNYRVYFDFV